jgi:ABC-type lipoprotein export system ATPase subunit
MSLLELQGVVKRYRDGRSQRVVLREVSLELDSGELGAVWGPRSSGRSTLLRVAAGIERPEEGVVLFEGRDLATYGEELLGGGIGYCHKAFGSGGWQLVLDQVMVSLLARGVAPKAARSRAHAALERTAASDCAALRLSALRTGEAMRVALARVLALEPRMLVVDEPTQGVEITERDGILSLLRSLADDGLAVLVSTGEPAGLSGAARAWVLSEGELRGAPASELAPVVPLRRAAGQRPGA